MSRHFLGAYNYIGEFAALLIACLIFGVMLYTKPKKTYVFRYVFNGTLLSIIAILVNLSIIFVADNPEKYFNKYIFMGQLLFFLILYNAILYCIFSYVNMMSIVRRSQRKEFLMMYGLLTLIYLSGVVIEIASGRLYSFGLEYVDIDHFVRFYTGAGLVCALFCFNATFTNRKNVSRVIWHAVISLVPVAFVILIVQMIVISSSHMIFVANTYVLVFAIGFMLFHSYPYDEITGAQSIYALNAYLDKNLGKRKPFIVYIRLYYPGIETLVVERNDLTLKGIAVCRQIESISNRVKIYRVAEDKYVNVIETGNEEDYVKIANRIRGIFDALKASIIVPVNYHIVAGQIMEELDEPIKCRQFFEYISRRFDDQNSSHFYMISPTDYDSFYENFEITRTLEDIRNKLDLDDERIIVYAQPIYSVETGSFRAAEALTRLKIGDRVINPDQFIPIAESSGTIHAVTCIVLNKVCRVIDTLADFYDFEAISINISSKEISQKDAYVELFDIINRYDFDPSMIRLELTESAMVENYEIANENMNSLTRAGIHFYLDDFGTGYSSLERVINCPFKTIKFDKTLLYKSLDDDRMNDIMTYMIEVFKKNGFVTLVEGVEDESQSQYSLEHGFEYIQGYHYAKPGPIEEIKKYFNRKTAF
ncbi:MAG: EAL domain-containing protein [Butyrivibrio sp.]|nr:EAL domain-containing protein [Butyrivibrio sp.]